MDLLTNHHNPEVMYIDLNSCFATVEQQANMHFRGRPLVIAAYTTPNGCIVSPSIEAKKLGIKVGMRVKDARLICPNVIVRDPDPDLVRDVHQKFRKITEAYSPIVVTKSIDEVVINFNNTLSLKRGLVNIGLEIKKRIRCEIGEWISCNIGISTNRFLAKLAASLHKPDGLDMITHQNLKTVYASVKLIDLNGINTRYEARLKANGIFTPLQFLEASEYFLRQNVFKSIVGYHWYLRLRGWEIDDVECRRKSFGQEYSLGKKTDNKEEIAQIIMKLCEKMGRRLRASSQAAKGIHLSLVYNDWTYWHKGRKLEREMYTTQEFYTKALWLLDQQSIKKLVRKIAVSCYDLVPVKNPQLKLFDLEVSKARKISDAVDKINDRYGEFVVTPAAMMNTQDLVIDRIGFKL